MPISQKVLFKCTKCFYKEFRIVGDVYPNKSDLKECPICSSKMKRIGDSKGIIEDFLEDIVNIFKGDVKGSK